ncbi:hypothetical protein [Acinetobacter seifertii]|uniref:hypothetical protein n=1 Tax=Acinetobacter seifertii TaxID=1530123 RepID=UPI00321A0CC2
MQQTNKDLQTVTQEIANSSQYQEIERFIQEAKQDQETHSTKHQSNKQISRLNAVFFAIVMIISN